MTYDFVSLPNRLHQHSVKWREVEADGEKLPLWVADMDFIAPPEIVQTIHAYADEQVFGYSYIANSLLEQIQKWEEEQHHYAIEKDSIILQDGVVPAINLAIQAFTKKGDAVVINSPVYPPFARSVLLNDRKLVRNSLTESKAGFVIDFEKLEQEIIENKVKLYILCNPHNPGGRVWSESELFKLGQLCQKHGVLLISDEIHQDLTLFGHEHHSFNTVSSEFNQFAIILSAATKTFNLAGTKCAYAIIENKDLREKFLKQRLKNSQQEINSLGMLLTEVAFKKGKQWLSELKEVLEMNINYVCSELETKTKIKVMKPQGTYLIWLDFSDYGFDDNGLKDKLEKEAKLILNSGISFGQEGEKHARMNVAAPFNLIEEAVQRLVETFGL